MKGISSKAPSGVLLDAPTQGPPRDFGNSVDHEKSVRPFKGIFCRDISEFESYMPSHAVRSLWLIYGTSKNARHSTRLARLKRARPRAGAWRSPERSAPFRDSPFAKKRFVDHIVCDTTIG